MELSRDLKLYYCNFTLGTKGRWKMLLEIKSSTEMTRVCVRIMILKIQEQAEWGFHILKEKFLVTSPNVRQD